MVEVQERILKRLPPGMNKMVFLPQTIEAFQLPDGDVLVVSNVGYSASRRGRKLKIIRRRIVEKEAP